MVAPRDACVSAAYTIAGVKPCLPTKRCNGFNTPVAGSGKEKAPEIACSWRFFRKLVAQ
jgi:hypothetical protein